MTVGGNQGAPFLQDEGEMVLAEVGAAHAGTLLERFCTQYPGPVHPMPVLIRLVRAWQLR